jgi:hypothetical protein
MQRRVIHVAVCVLVLASARDAAAQVGQAWTDRGYFNFNIGFESVSGQLNDATTPTIYGETGSLSVSQPIDSGSFVDFSAGARVWRNLSAGIGFHQGSTDGEATVQGSIPHPLFPNRNRPLALSVSDLSRSERAVHIQLGYMLLLTDKIQVHVMAGPSFYKLRQDVVSDVTLSDPEPFTTVGGTAVVSERTDTPTGFNIGADVAYVAYQRSNFKVGAGMFLRYSAASANVVVLQNGVDSDLGGLQVGFGVRTRF